MKGRALTNEASQRMGVVQGAVALAVARGTQDRFAYVVLSPVDGVPQRQALGNSSGNRARQRAAGAMGGSRIDATLPKLDLLAISGAQ